MGPDLQVAHLNRAIPAREPNPGSFFYVDSVPTATRQQAFKYKPSDFDSSLWDGQQVEVVADQRDLQAHMLGTINAFDDHHNVLDEIVTKNPLARFSPWDETDNSGSIAQGFDSEFGDQLLSNNGIPTTGTPERYFVEYTNLTHDNDPNDARFTAKIEHAVNSEGEWYLDRSNHKLYYYTTASLNSQPCPLHFMAPQYALPKYLPADPSLPPEPAGYLFDFKNTQHIIIHGLTFAYTDTVDPTAVDHDTNLPINDYTGSNGGFAVPVAPAVSFKASLLGSDASSLTEKARFEGNTIAHVGGYGLQVTRATDANGNMYGGGTTSIVDNTIFDCGGGGIMLGSGVYGYSEPHDPTPPSISLFTSDNPFVSRNTIHDLNGIWKDAPAISDLCGEPAIILSNTIFTSSTAGIQLGIDRSIHPMGIPFADTLIQDNDVHDVMQELYNGGGIAFNGVQDFPWACVRHNYVHDIGPQTPATVPSPYGIKVEGHTALVGNTVRKCTWALLCNTAGFVSQNSFVGPVTIVSNWIGDPIKSLKPGDFNADLYVNDADYTAWADFYNRNPLIAHPTWCPGQGTGGGYNDADYTNWADNYAGTTQNGVIYTPTTQNSRSYGTNTMLAEDEQEGPSTGPALTFTVADLGDGLKGYTFSLGDDQLASWALNLTFTGINGATILPEESSACTHFVGLLDGVMANEDGSYQVHIGTVSGEGYGSLDAMYIVCDGDLAWSGDIARLGVQYDVEGNTLPPDSPLVAPVLEEDSDTGSSNSDRITNTATPTFDVVGGPYFRFYCNGVQISGDMESGSTYTLPAQADGTYEYSYAAVNAGGVVSAERSPAVQVTIDTAVAASISTVSGYGEVSQDQTTCVTSNLQPTLVLDVAEDSQAVVMQDGNVVASTSSWDANTGKLTVTFPSNLFGAYTVTVSDVAGNQTAPMNMYVLLSGDANGDGAVTNADLTAWWDNYSQSVSSEWLQTNPGWQYGDWNRDGVVNDADYTMWSNNDGTNVTGAGPLDGTGVMTWTSVDLGNGLTGYTFALNSTYTGIWYANVVFSGASGVTINQQLGWGEGGEEVDTQARANYFNSHDPEDYQRALDTWVYSPFQSFGVGIFEGEDGSYHVNVDATNRSTTNFVYLVANGDVTWTGIASHHSEDYSLIGTTAA